MFTDPWFYVLAAIIIAVLGVAAVGLTLAGRRIDERMDARTARLRAERRAAWRSAHADEFDGGTWR